MIIVIAAVTTFHVMENFEENNRLLPNLISHGTSPLKQRQRMKRILSDLLSGNRAGLKLHRAYAVS